MRELADQILSGVVDLPAVRKKGHEEPSLFDTVSLRGLNYSLDMLS